MAVKILISRRLKPDAEVDVLLALNRLRAAAMEQPGYISGETLVGYHDPARMVVLSVWDSLGNWARWRDHERRRELEALVEPWLDEAPAYEVFRSGARSGSGAG